MFLLSRSCQFSPLRLKLNFGFVSSTEIGLLAEGHQLRDLRDFTIRCSKRLNFRWGAKRSRAERRLTHLNIPEKKGNNHKEVAEAQARTRPNGQFLNTYYTM